MCYLYNILSHTKQNSKKLNYVLGLLIKINENILKLFDSRCTPIVEEDTDENNDLSNVYSSYNYYGSYVNNTRYSQMPEDNRSSILEKILKNLFNILEKNKFDFLENFGSCIKMKIKNLLRLIWKNKEKLEL